MKVEMHFLPDIYVSCDVCHGKRYDRETLDIIQREVDQRTSRDDGGGGDEFLRALPQVAELQTLLDVGFGYISLDNPPPLSRAARPNG